MKYDDASWHYGGTFPADLPESAAATHIGMYVTWALLRGMAGEVHDEDESAISDLVARTVTPGEFLIDCCDEKFSEYDLDDEGNAFTQIYYGGDSPAYFQDLEQIAKDLPTTYHLPDSWEVFDKFAPILDQRFQDWKESLR
jgi:hypothetical protein